MKLQFTDIFYTAHIHARIEELEKEKLQSSEEYGKLWKILHTIGGGFGEEFRGEFYPDVLVRDSYFTEYARELLIAEGAIKRELPPELAIDWEKTAQNVREDYAPIDVLGVKYWYR